MWLSNAKVLCQTHSRDARAGVRKIVVWPRKVSEGSHDGEHERAHR